MHDDARPDLLDAVDDHLVAFMQARGDDDVDAEIGSDLQRAPLDLVLGADDQICLQQVMADRVQLQQALMNLMLNGIEAMGDTAGELSIKSQLGEGEQVLISVSDTGVGLPPQQADQIFNALFTTKPHGTGMGLRISRTIAESHGGRLWAADNSPHGATFHLTLPLKTEAHP